MIAIAVIIHNNNNYNNDNSGIIATIRIGDNQYIISINKNIYNTISYNYQRQ